MECVCQLNCYRYVPAVIQPELPAFNRVFFRHDDWQTVMKQQVFFHKLMMIRKIMAYDLD